MREDKQQIIILVEYNNLISKTFFQLARLTFIHSKNHSTFNFTIYYWIGRYTTLIVRKMLFIFVCYMI